MSAYTSTVEKCARGEGYTTCAFNFIVVRRYDLFFLFFYFFFILPPETYLQCVYIGKITIDTKNT